MDVTPVVASGQQLINGYGDGGFTIAAVRYEGSVLVFADRTETWRVSAVADLTQDCFEPFFAAPPRVLLLGCGKSMALPPRPLREALKARGMVVETMDTGAACRTFNVLLSEGRSVAAALIAV